MGESYSRDHVVHEVDDGGVVGFGQGAEYRHHTALFGVRVGQVCNTYTDHV